MLRFLQHVLILFFVWLSTTSIFSQITELSIQHITDEQGTSFGFSGDVVYDSLGIVWISGWDKVMRYDGKNLTRFYTGSTKHSLDLVGRTEIIKLKDQRFWVMDNQKIQLFNPYSFRIDSTINSSSILLEYGARNATILAGQDDDFWLLSSEFVKNDTLYTILSRGSKNKLEIIDFIPVYEGMSVTMQLAGDKLVVVSSNEILKYSADAKVKDIQSIEDNDMIYPRSFKALDGSIWVKGNGIREKSIRDVFRVKPNSDSFEKIEIASSVDLRQTKEIAVKGSEIWFAGQNEKLIKYNFETGEQIDYSKLISNMSDYAYIGSEPQKITIDNNGIIWLATSRGLLKIIEKVVPVKTYLTDKEENCTYSFCSMRGMAEDDDGNIFFSYYSGIHKLDADSGNLEVYQRSERNQLKGAYSLKYLAGKIYWLGMVIDLETGKVDNLITDLFKSHVTSCTDGQQNIWFYTWGPQALYHFNVHDRILKKIACPEEFQTIEFEMNDMVWNPSSKRIFCATSTSGLVIIDTLGNKIEQLTKSDSPGSLSTANIKAVHLDGDSICWIGHSAGFSKINHRNKLIENYSINPTDNLAVVGILEDGMSNLWMSTDKGIYRYNKQSNEILGFSENTDISLIEFNRSSAFKDRNDRMYFGSISGVYSFDPTTVEDHLKREQYSDIILTQYARYNSREGKLYQFEAGLSQLDKIELSYHDTYFTLDFISPNYLSTLDAQYSYILEGFESAWRKPSSSTTLKYDRLPPGEYLLRIRVTSAGNDSPQAEKAIWLVVNNIWYKTGWFYLCSSLLFLAVMYILFRIRLEQKLKLQRIREKISVDLHDEVGTTLTGLAMQSEMISYSLQGKQKGKMDSIIEMSRNAMLQMRDVVWALDSSKDNVGDLLSKISEFAYEVLEPREIETVISSNLPRDKALAIHVKKELYLICKEAIANTAKHSNGNRLTIELNKVERSLILTIFDNGNNINIKKQHQGSGLKNMERRATFLKGKISFEYDDGFLIKLEISK